MAIPFEEYVDRMNKGPSPSTNFSRFFRQRDEAAVRAALTLPWSTGPVEGHIHRWKLIKRQMYGRAKLDLLRIRVLFAA